MCHLASGRDAGADPETVQTAHVLASVLGRRRRRSHCKLEASSGSGETCTVRPPAQARIHAPVVLRSTLLPRSAQEGQVGPGEQAEYDRREWLIKL